MKTRTPGINFAIVILAIGLLAFKSDKPAYRIYNIEGKTTSYNKMMKDIVTADIVFFGELHNDPIAHWLELEITKGLYTQKGDSLILAAEMFERDDQLIIDEYLGKLYTAKKFEAEVKLWSNYKTDYKPLIDIALENELSFIASNVPRRYASMVNKNGLEILDTLSDMAKTYLAPLPMVYDPEVKCYKGMLNMGRGMPAGMSENLPKAQALKDATMAYSISEYWSPGKTVIHYNGSYHSKNFEGIIWYLNRYVDNLKIVTIEIVSQEDISELEEDNIGVASFVIAVPSTMTKTY